jgi:hypothetical protein
MNQALMTWQSKLQGDKSLSGKKQMMEVVKWEMFIKSMT